MSKFGLDLRTLYGKHYGANFNPNTRNIRTGAGSNLSHHCLQCGGPMKRSCYEKLHECYCIACLTDSNGKPVLDDKGKEQICGERFQLASPGGCFTHPYNYNYNLVFKEALRGKELSREAKGLKKADADADRLANDMADMKVEDPKSHHWYNEQKRLTKYAKSKPAPREPTKAKPSKLQPAPSYKLNFGKKK